MPPGPDVNKASRPAARKDALKSPPMVKEDGAKQIFTGPKSFDGKPMCSADDLKKFVADKLESSGLTETDADALGIVGMLPADTARQRIWKGTAHPALRIPYYDPSTGEAMPDGLGGEFCRFRCLTHPLPTPPPDKDGKPRRFPKYVQLPKTPIHAYFPRTMGWAGVVTDATIALVITEGELKAACGAKHDFPVIGLGGVWSFMSKERGIGFLPELDAIRWHDRKVFICFDAEATENPDIERASQCLAAKLRERGAAPFKVSLPRIGEGKTGLDDFIVARGAEAFRALLDEAEELKDWREELYARMSSGLPVCNLHNTNVALRNAPELMDAFKFNEMTFAIDVVAALPGDDKWREDRPMMDPDVVLVQGWLQEPNGGGLRNVREEDVRKAIGTRARQRSYHPIRDWLRSLKWDGVERLHSWMVKHLGVADSEYTQAVGKMFLIQMVARVENPGCKADYVPVLFDPAQGEGKSTVCEVLAGAKYFSDKLPDLDKDEVRVSQHLRGLWLLEIAELSALKRTDVEKIKGFISQKVEKFTPKYGRSGDVTEPRQCVFIGTTNEQGHLKDESGNRRFWPVTIGAIDIEGLRAGRDQLFAEAFAAHQRGEHWWPDRELEVDVFREAQAAYMVEEPYCALISAWLENNRVLNGYMPPGISGNRVGAAKVPFNNTNIAIYVLGHEPKDLTQTTTKKVSSAMVRLGCVQDRSGGVRRWVTADECKAKVVAYPQKRRLTARDKA